MKKLILVIVSGFLSCLAFSQSSKNKEKINLSILLNYTTPKQEKVDFTSIARVTYPIFNKVYIGTEINYLISSGKNVNQDYAGGVIFGKINPYLGFTAELGYSYNRIISSSRREIITKGLFASIGYEAKINDHWSVDLQYRAMPAKYLESNIINSKVFLLGSSYKFIK